MECGRTQVVSVTVLGVGGMKYEEECMGLGLTTQLQRQVGTQIAKLIFLPLQGLI